MTDRANTSLTFSASWRTSTSGVSMEPMAPGVGTGIMLEMACRIVSTTHHPPLKSPLVQDGDHSSLWKDVMVHLKAATLLRITYTMHSHGEEGNIGRRHREIGGEKDLSVIDALLVGRFRRTANGEVPLEIIALLMTTSSLDQTLTGAAWKSGFLFFRMF